MTIDENVSDSSRSPDVWCVIEIAIGVRDILIDGRRNMRTGDGHTRGDSLEGTGGRDWLPNHRLNRRDGNVVRVLPKG